MVYTYLHINWIGEPPVVSRNNKNRRWTSELIHILMDFNERQTRPRYFVRFYRIFYRGLLGKCDWCFMFALTNFVILTSHWFTGFMLVGCEFMMAHLRHRVGRVRIFFSFCRYFCGVYSVNVPPPCFIFILTDLYDFNAGLICKPLKLVSIIEIEYYNFKLAMTL